MLRLVWKDAVAARWILLAGLPVYAINLAPLAGIWPVYVTIGLVGSAILAFGSLAIEEIQGTGTLWASLPVRRRDIVFARYLTAVLGVVVGLTVSFGVERVAALVRAASGGASGTSLAVSATVHAVMLLVLLLVGAVLLPLCFRLGAGNGVLAFGAIAIGAILALALGGQLVLWLAGIANPLFDPALYRGTADTEHVRAAMEWLRSRWRVLMGGSVLVTALALIASAGVSRNFFESRDLA